MPNRSMPYRFLVRILGVLLFLVALFYAFRVATHKLFRRCTQIELMYFFSSRSTPHSSFLSLCIKVFLSSVLLGLMGFAEGSSKHAFIIARMELGAERILRLITESRHDEAVALMNTEIWGAEVEEGQEGAGNGQASINH